jgi:diguanylate cyclase (GGDEF)-like protein
MQNGPNKTEVFGDYAAFMHALLPSALGFFFHDRHGNLFWDDGSPDANQLNDEYHRIRNLINLHGELPHNQGRVKLQNATAYLIRLTSDTGKNLGVLTALVATDHGGMPWGFCADLLKPVIRTLQRELSLRVHLLDIRKSSGREPGKAHSSEYDFLRDLDGKTKASRNCTEALENSLQLCVDHLRLESAIFLAPERGLRIAVGANPGQFKEAQMLYESMQDSVSENPHNAVAALHNRAMPDPSERTRSWPVMTEGNQLSGILVLSRAAKTRPFSDDAFSLVNFVISTLENLLERGFDPLTGLMKWPDFESALAEACADEFAEHTLLYLDIDKLDVINNTAGREAGDELLKKFADILREALAGQAATRIAGNSFAALLQNSPPEQAERLANEICAQLHELDYTAATEAFKPSVSIGVAPLVLPDDMDIRSTLVPAEVACRAAKDRGRGRVEIYQSSDVSIIRRMDEINIVGSIRSAIEAGRLTLFAQPIVRLDDPDTIEYYELLVRLLDAADNPIEPAVFMNAAESYQLMEDIDRWVVSKAIETLATQGTTLNNHTLRFAVNLSGQSIGNDDFCQFVREELYSSGIDPERICFEITETVAVSNIRNAQAFMEEMKSLGCKFSLDDFGTGLSSFGYLKLFPVDKLKIDGSFVHDICKNEVSRSMVTAIAQIAKVMNLETVAEYVQDEATITALREIGVTWAQGFHIGAPARLNDVFDKISIEDTVSTAEVETAILKALPTA